MHDDTLRIQLLGDFSVCANGTEISTENVRSGRLWRLFKYMALNRKGPVPTDRLIDLLWDESDCDNPLGALYTLMYRLRGLLGAQFEPARTFFVFRQRSYEWLDNAPVEVDTERFEAAVNRALACNDNTQAESLLLEAVGLYGGVLFADAELESWMIAPREYYKRLYSKCVVNLCTLYEKQGRSEDVIAVCERALGFDDCDEDFHYAYLKSLISLGLYTQAQRHVDGPVKQMTVAYGLQVSPRVQQLADSIRYHGNEHETDILKIADQLTGDDDFLAPFFCDLEAFRKIFLLERRAARRTSRPLCFAYATVTDAQGGPPDDDTLAAVFSALRRPESFGLRQSDVVSQYSRTQILMLLPGATPQGADVALRRFSEQFFISSGIQTVRFQFKTTMF